MILESVYQIIYQHAEKEFTRLRANFNLLILKNQKRKTERKTLDQPLVFGARQQKWLLIRLLTYHEVDKKLMTFFLLFSIMI